MSSAAKIKVGIAGSAGYTGGELIRLLLHHPKAEIVFAHSNSQAGKAIYKVHTDLFAETDLVFTNKMSQAIDVLFLCLGHGEAKKFLKTNPPKEKIKIIDLSQDHRISNPNSLILNPSWVYGLPELNREKIRKANHVANPGCFATCIQLGLLPLAAKGMLNKEIHVSATTGSTGAGQSLSDTSNFSWRQNNLGAYKAFGHQHLEEMRQSLVQLQKNFKSEISLVPHRGSFTRGIFASIYTDCDVTLEKAKKIFTDFYSSHPFVHVSDDNIDLKQVVNTNKCLLHLEKHGNKLMIISVIDNLLKGASGQALQNMNLMFGMEETTGLKLKALAF
jgi:N-acetyl-gamma-glutamyl-phosphate reductase